MPYILRWLLAVAAVIGVILLVAAVRGDTTTDNRIPVPPPGYQYCTTDNDQLSFCRRGER